MVANTAQANDVAWRRLCACLFVSLATVLCNNAVQGEDAILRLTVAPEAIQLTRTNRAQQVVVTGHTESGHEIDLTRKCEYEFNGGVAKIHDTVVQGNSNGTETLRVRFESSDTSIPVTVTNFGDFPAVNFASDIAPILTKHRCNGGGCHGKQGGQNGFQLSVFGFNPAADFEAIIQHSRGRRVSPSSPLRSLILQKATGLVAHGGGARIDADSIDAQLVQHWIKQGTVYAAPNQPTIDHLEVFPAERVLPTSSDQQLLVTAIYSDGFRKDVTADAVYTSNASFIADVNETGLIATGATPGEVAVTIAYMGHVSVARMLIPRTAAMEEFPIAGNNRIDDLVFAKLAKMGITPSELSDDATFLRRLYLDAIGTLPTASEIRSFLTDQSPHKRQRAIESVFNRSEYASFWAQRWADILMVDRKKLGERGAYQFFVWLREQLKGNRPYDVWVRELITASGNSAQQGPVNFYRALRTPEDRAKAVSQAFLGVRLDCAQCHHHPFDKWSQEDFYAFTGFFNGIVLQQLTQDRELLFHDKYKPVNLPHTGQTVPLRPLGAAPIAISHEDPRLELARWLTEKDNPWFTRIAVNRIWKHYLGKGLVEPEDDLRQTNPPTNAALLEYLEREFIESGFDLKALSKLVVQSRTYQLSSTPNKTNAFDQQNFSHHYVKRMGPDVLLDAVSQTAGIPEMFPGLPPGTRAIEVWDNRLNSYFLDTFGRSQRTSPCECGTSSAPTMAQTLHMMNAPEINAKIASHQGRVANLLAQDTDVASFVEELCLTALGRPATEKELRIADRLFNATDKKQAGEDFLWTLLNSYDFLFIH